MRKILSRRTLLQGAGAAISLPFFEEMWPRAAMAQEAAPPMRLLTMFFGLGLARDEAIKEFNGPLAPYASLADKMAFFTNLDVKQAHTFGSGEPHFKVGDVIFVGDPQKREYEASGPSIEQLVKKKLHPNGVPTKLGSKSVGMWFRSGSVSQYTRHWNHDGSPGERPERRPTRIFEQMFGDGSPTPGGAPDLAAIRKQNLKRSVLDSIVGEYKRYTGDNSPLGANSKAKLAVHLDNIRNVEKRLAPLEAALEDAIAQECTNFSSVVDPDGIPYDLPQGGSGGSAPIIAHEDLLEAFKLQGELMALALRCDVLRFGSMLFVGSGGHVGLRGTYNSNVGTLEFNKDLPGTSAHDAYFHKNLWDKCKVHAHYCQTALASALIAMDNPDYLESNGKTVLDNSLVILGTDYGGGGSTIGHQPEGVFHAIAGGNGHFKPGFYDTQHNVIDVYEAALKPYNLTTDMGTGRHNSFRYTPRDIRGLLV